MSLPLYKQSGEPGFMLYGDLFYNLRMDDKIKYLEHDYVQRFLGELNCQQTGFGNKVRNIFIRAVFPDDWEAMRITIISDKGMGPIMAVKPYGEGRPWGHEFMDVLYGVTEPVTPLDSLLKDSISGKAVFNRKPSVVRNSIPILETIMGVNQIPKKINLINLGSAFGYDAFELLEACPNLASLLNITNIDIAEDAVSFGNRLAIEKKMSNVSFIAGDMLKLSKKISEQDIAWLIGMLCGANFSFARLMMKKTGEYLKNGGLVIGACVTDVMPRVDLFTCFILEEILGWRLCYRNCHEVEKLFVESSFKYLGSFSEGKEKFYQIGIGQKQ